jgi:Cu(I)/Ag(I) efflux system membrane fusion protein
MNDTVCAALFSLRRIMVVPFLLLCLLGLAACQQKGSETPTVEAHDHASEAKVEYTCPMHPFIIKDKPGACPICGMDLVKKSAGAAANAGELEKIGQVAVSTTQRVMANVAIIHAEERSLTKEIAATGIVAYDQRRQAKVTAWVSGRIDRLMVSAVGDLVTKGRPVAELYSPDLVSAQQEYLLAIRSRDRLKDSSIPSISEGGEGLVASAKQRLLLMGVKEQQISGLEKTGQATIKLPVYTPLSGVVIEKTALEGQYVNVGDPLFIVADLSSVWVEAEIFENDLSAVKPGQRVEITSRAWPGKSFWGRVLMVYPFLDPKTRTVKVRIEIANSGMQLKPDMFVQALIRLPLSASVVVPVAALMDTGARQVVWIQVKDGVFEPRDVKAGARVGDEVQILKGLTKGEVIAASGAYLIDSESQLRGGPAAGHEGHGAAPPSSAPAGKKDELKMDDMKM